MEFFSDGSTCIFVSKLNRKQSSSLFLYEPGLVTLHTGSQDLRVSYVVCVYVPEVWRQGAHLLPSFLWLLLKQVCAGSHLESRRGLQTRSHTQKERVLWRETPAIHSTRMSAPGSVLSRKLDCLPWGPSDSLSHQRQTGSPERACPPATSRAADPLWLGSHGSAQAAEGAQGRAPFKTS